MSSLKNKRKRFFIFDGYALLYRAHFALIKNPLKTTYGLETSALYGFINQVLKLIKSENPDLVACAFDSKEKTFRHKMYEEYKAQRPKMPDELQNQLPFLWELLKVLKLPILKKPGFEADDIIGTLAIEANNEGYDTFIVSGDKDFMQLINDHIFLYAPGTRWKPTPIIYDSKKVEDKWGVPPDKIIDLLGLMGDSSDNIPGVSGVGEKTAVKLIKEYGTLEVALENADKVKNKRVHNGLKNNKELSLLSKELVKIKTDVSLPLKIQDFKRKIINEKACLQKFRELEFFALEKLIIDTSKNSVNKTSEKLKSNYKIILSIKDLYDFISILKKVESFSFNLEMLTKSRSVPLIVGFSFFTDCNRGWYIPIKYQEKKNNNFGLDDLKIVLNLLKPVFEDDKILKVAYNIKLIMRVLIEYSIKIKVNIFDSQLAAHLINPELKNYNLNHLCFEYLNIDISLTNSLLGKGRNKITPDKVSVDSIAKCSIEHSDKNFELVSVLIKSLKDLKLFSYYKEIEIPLLLVLVNMESNGVYIDSKFLKNMSNDIGNTLDELKTEIYKLSKMEFNINSSQQLANILFDNLELPQIKKRSTAEEVLKKLSSFHELPIKIIQYRKYNKLKTTYIDSLPELIFDKTKRIHSTFNQTITLTGRLSSTNPNFQNIPIRTDEGKEIRKAFRGQKKGWKILSADYSQVELRIMAHMSKDPGLILAFKNENDIHLETASKVFKVSKEAVLPEMRRTAKIVNFGIMYGAGPFRISQELGISRHEAVSLIESYFIQYSGIKTYINKILNQAREMKYVETLLGRRRPVWDANSDNGLRRKAAERMAINMPIQGSAAELIKLAMLSIRNLIKEYKLKSKLILQIHDELLFELPPEEEDFLIKSVVEIMEKSIKLEVPLVVDYGVGNNWFEAH
jgi:DNA polymerase I